MGAPGSGKGVALSAAALGRLKRRVREWRAAQAMTQAELATAMGVSLRTVRYLERDGGGVSAATLRAWRTVSGQATAGPASSGVTITNDAPSGHEEDI